MALVYEVQYGLLFPDAASAAAAVVTNGSVNLGNMSPDAAEVTWPAATIVQLPPSLVITGLTGVAGPVTGAYASFYNGAAASTVTFSPVSKLLSSQSSVSATATGTVGGAPIAPTAVVFEWNGTIIGPGQPAINPILPVPIAGKFQVQTILYTGDGTASRTIATAMDLSVGRVMIWIFPDQDTVGPICRSNDASMTGTALIGGGGVIADSGIGTFGSTGFTVIKGANSG